MAKVFFLSFVFFFARELALHGLCRHGNQKLETGHSFRDLAWTYELA